MFKHILLATDFSDPAKVAAHEARALAGVFGTQVTLMHVVDRDDSSEMRIQAEPMLRELESELFAEVDGLSLRAHEHEHTDVAICASAAEVGADLIVIGRHGGHSFTEHFLGSTTERVARHAGCSVWVAHPDDAVFGTGRRVMACSDLSDASVRASVEASEIAERFAAPLSLAHVYTVHAPPFAYAGDDARRDSGMEAHARSTLETLGKDKLDGRAHDVVLKEHTSAVVGLCELASEHQAGLMVVGTTGRTGLPRLLIGSVAERVVRHAPCSILVARDEKS